MHFDAVPAPPGMAYVRLLAPRTDLRSTCRSVSFGVVSCLRMSSCREQGVSREAPTCRLLGVGSWPNRDEEGGRADNAHVNGAEGRFQDAAESLRRVIQVVETPLPVRCSQERPRRLCVVALETEDRPAEQDPLWAQNIRDIPDGDRLVPFRAT